MQRTADVERPDVELIATCDECRCACWARDDVALLQQVGFRSSDLKVRSGGRCSRPEACALRSYSRPKVDFLLAGGWPRQRVSKRFALILQRYA
jgi:hypothetical protein